MNSRGNSTDLRINGVKIEAEFAEAFDMKATRIIITGHDRYWVDQAAMSMTGFGTSVVGCGIEIAVEQNLAPEQTPDGRPGVSVLAFAVSGSELEKQIPLRLGQCVLTCPTTAVFAGSHESADDSNAEAKASAKRIPMGKSLRYFGDGHQISKVVNTRDGDARYWRIPVMDGEFICQHDVARVSGVGGGNFILLGRDIDAVSVACRAAVDAMRNLPGMITPFPGGTARSGSKVGSKYAGMFASTNEAYCPVLRELVPTKLHAGENCAMEIVIDGLSAQPIAHAMKIGISAACQAAGESGLLRVTAGNYGGKLGRHHFHLHEVMS
ncbi:Formyltransferase/hydrolase complex subunit D [Rubripirellula obstinata]|uniref:Formylmethanofuran--tetrahydromethanopterin formyltransferase n=1 Tax=Rubripirellula obstinata TaxID=406547 RepID=A0A5B1CEX2_9BACT|nr:formylmethanofuran--tetrahydromethanopterin N-formyltransferase [Rubripirellula obstinata]KAA1258425.1 Formyltransferase/hydrolase complex subunit D [Rubripirellula obstinata]